MAAISQGLRSLGDDIPGFGCRDLDSRLRENDENAERKTEFRPRRGRPQAAAGSHRRVGDSCHTGNTLRIADHPLRVASQHVAANN
jgi:hypothetical protein